jgi:hydroxypyruvate isomerase
MMDRRGFLKTAALTAGAAATSAALPLTRAIAAPAASNRIRLSMTWGMFRKAPVPEALALLTRHGYEAFEMFNWRDAALLDSVAEKMKKHKLECACLIANKGVKAPGCGLTNPKERDGFLSEISLSLEAAAKVNCKRLVVLTGDEVPGLSREAQMESCVAGLKAAAPILERSGVTAIVEILNTYVDHPGYFLYYVRDGMEMVDRVGSPNVKLLFDIYHTQIMEGNLINLIRRSVAHTAHYHVADNPGRNQPGTGEVNYRNVYKAILDTGYQGFVALEYGRTNDVELNDDMAAQRKLATF